MTAAAERCTCPPGCRDCSGCIYLSCPCKCTGSRPSSGPQSCGDICRCPEACDYDHTSPESELDRLRREYREASTAVADLDVRKAIAVTEMRRIETEYGPAIATKADLLDRLSIAELKARKGTP